MIISNLLQYFTGVKMNAGRIFSHLPVIKTKRLILRNLRFSDAADIFNYASNPEVSKYTIWSTHKSINDSKDFITWHNMRQRQGNPVSWGVIERATNKLIGTAGFESYSVPHKTASIGYAVGFEYWNKGYTTEAVKKIISFGFSMLKLNRIEAVCDVNNGASARVMEKSGMKFEGVQRSRIISAEGRIHDVKGYAIIRSDIE
jgi:ribosomal-protein-alanine N-acetyltransferase